MNLLENLSYDTMDFHKTLEVADFVKNCVDVERVKGYCKTCPNYCKVWSCPEHDFNPLLYWSLFHEMELYGRKIILAENLTERTFSSEEQLEILNQIFFKERKHFLDMLRGLETEKSISLHVGYCDLCGKDNCARKEGKPCRFPKKKRFSVESLGGDVVKAAELYFNIPLCWVSNGRLPEYFMLVGALLKI